MAFFTKSPLEEILMKTQHFPDCITWQSVTPRPPFERRGKQWDSESVNTSDAGFPV